MTEVEIMDCPNPDCKDRVQGHHTTLFGKDGMSGLVSCVGKKLSRNTAIVIAVAIIGSASGVTVYGLDAAKKDRAAVTENKSNIGKIQVELEAIKEAVVENQVSLEEIQNDMEKHMIDPNTLKELITDAVKEGNR